MKKSNLFDLSRIDFFGTIREAGPRLARVNTLDILKNDASDIFRFAVDRGVIRRGCDYPPGTCGFRRYEECLFRVCVYGHYKKREADYMIFIIRGLVYGVPTDIPGDIFAAWYDALDFSNSGDRKNG